MNRKRTGILALVMACVLVCCSLPLAAVASNVSTFFTPPISLSGEGNDAQGEEGEDSGEVVEEEIDAVDAPITYTVSFTVNGALYHQETVDPETLVPMPEDPQPGEDGLPFQSWFAEGESMPFSPFRLITGDITLVAKFSDKVLITFFDTDGSELEVVELSVGEPIVAPTKEPTLDMGETVGYWYIEGDETVEFPLETEATTNLRLHPFVMGRSVAVFITRGTEVAPQEGTRGFTAVDPFSLEPDLEVTREGFIFSHWSDTDGGDTQFNFAGTPIEGVVYIYAVWTSEMVPYMINYWCEKPDMASTPGHPENPANLGQYEFIYAKEMDKVPAGSEVYIDEATANKNYGGTATDVLNYADYVWSETKEISGTGTTVVNVYYKRTEFTFTFDMRYAYSASASNG